MTEITTATATVETTSDTAKRLSIFRKYHDEIALIALGSAIIFLSKEVLAANNRLTDYLQQSNVTCIKIIENNTIVMQQTNSLLFEVKEILRNNKNGTTFNPFINNKK